MRYILFHVGKSLVIHHPRGLAWMWTTSLPLIGFAIREKVITYPQTK
jgi:hypothetical protein